MEEINIRIAAIIRESGETKTEWAEKLKVTPQFISSLCNGKKSPSNRTIGDICRVSGVREDWLKCGKGEMYAKKKSEPLDDLLSGLLDGDNVTDEDRVLIKNFLELSDDSRRAVIDFVQKCAKELAAPMPPSAPDTDVAAKLAALERQNRELTAKQQELMEKLDAIEKEDTEREPAESASKTVFLSQFR